MASRRARSSFRHAHWYVLSPYQGQWSSAWEPLPPGKDLPSCCKVLEAVQSLLQRLLPAVKKATFKWAKNDIIAALAHREVSKGWTQWAAPFDARYPLLTVEVKDREKKRGSSSLCARREVGKAQNYGQYITLELLQSRPTFGTTTARSRHDITDCTRVYFK